MKKKKILTKILAGCALGIMLFSTMGTLLFYIIAM